MKLPIPTRYILFLYKTLKKKVKKVSINIPTKIDNNLKPLQSWKQLQYYSTIICNETLTITNITAKYFGIIIFNN